MSADWTNRIIWSPAGHYVAAVSGGVDSVALLDLLAQTGDYQLEVAYFDHGWGPHGQEAGELVRSLATEYRLPFHESRAGEGRTSEAAARDSRYRFLRRLSQKLKVEGVITAHHHDDLLETVALNLRRGSGRRGLTPFSADDIVRPLVKVRKLELEAYAKDRRLKWLEDPTNSDASLARNALRQEGIDLEALVPLVEEAAVLNARVDDNLRKQPERLPVATLRQLSADELQEVLVAAAHQAKPGAELDRRTVEALALDIKTGRLKGRRALGGGLFAVPVRGTVAVVFTPGKAGPKV